ncbi:MAG: rhomboid family intramembrane serine protease [Bacteroidales bacterium]|nr:rhomboid family intramembrane serine protease [Bacteroidales bacterium]MCF8404356.1 rhomboid family intramembrane serine protease [Bacteroidales bacterium]
MNGQGTNNFGGNFANIQNPFTSLKAYFRNNNILVKLIIINVAVWLVIRILEVFLDLFNTSFAESIVQWLAVPANPMTLITHPWTLFTYMFLHFDFSHILFNMLWLYWFGKIFLEYLSERQLLATYIFGGLAGALFYILSFNIFPKFQEAYLLSMALGASASVMAIVVAISFYVPDYRIHLLFIGPVKIYYIAIFSLILDVLMIQSSNSGGHLAHIGGALWGFYSVYMLRKGMDFSRIFSRIPKIKFSSGGGRGKKHGFGNVYTNSRPVPDEDYNLQKKKSQEQIDKILDKISKSGYDSLTKEEKELLFRTSKKQ